MVPKSLENLWARSRVDLAIRRARDARRTVIERSHASMACLPIWRGFTNDYGCITEIG
jgi:hypothetical protein